MWLYGIGMAAAVGMGMYTQKQYEASEGKVNERLFVGMNGWKIDILE